MEEDWEGIGTGEGNKTGKNVVKLRRMPNQKRGSMKKQRSKRNRH